MTIISLNSQLMQQNSDLLIPYIEIALTTVATSSRKTYLHTYRQWLAWSQNQNQSALLSPMAVIGFLRDQPVTKSTRQRQLSALRKLARLMALHTQHPEYHQIYEALLLIKVPDEGIGGTERIRRALDTQEVWKVLDVWSNTSLINLRNRAMLAVLFYTGVRRSELTALRWVDVNFESGTLVVRHGKGDKRREVAIIEDSRNTALQALKLWRNAQQDAGNSNYEFVFCPIAKGGRVGEDKPMNVRAINQVIERTSKVSGIEFTPHDARRTLGTDLLTNNNYVADVQAQLGHSRASTTLDGYAMPADARKRRSRFKASY